MPEAFISAVTWFGSAVGAGTGLFAYAAQIGTALYYATAIVGSLAYGNSKRQRMQRAARDAYNAGLQDRLVMVSTTDGPRSRVYGRVRNVDGVVFKATRGALNEFYTLVISLAGHEVDAIETVYFDDVALTLDADGWVQNEPWQRSRRDDYVESGTTVSGTNNVTLSRLPVAGSVSVTVGAEGQLAVPSVSGSVVTFTAAAGQPYRINYQHAAALPKARVRRYLGGAGQNLSTVLQPLFPSLITANDRFAGDAGLIVDLEFDPDAFPTGVPTVSAVMRGAKCFDPRTGLTVWTENPALIARDWAINQDGGAMPASAIDDAAVIAAANACDVNTTFTTSGGSAVRKLYTCGIVANTDNEPDQVLDEIVESMAGRWGWSSGKLRMRAGVYRAPVLTITEAWLSGTEDITVVPEPPMDEAVNVMRPSIADAANAYTPLPAPEVRSAAYIAADGRELPSEVTYGGVTDADHAQHIAGVQMREMRNALTVVLPCNLRAFQLELFDVVSVTLPRFGWSAKTFEVVDWRFSLTGGVVLTLKETAAAIYTPDALFNVLDLTPNTLLPNPFAVPTIGGLALATGSGWVRELADGSMLPRIHASWTAVNDAAVRTGGAVELRYGRAQDAESLWTTIRLPGTAVEHNIDGVTDGVVYVAKARARNQLVAGDWSLQKAVRVTAKEANPANVAGFTAQIVPGAVRFTWNASGESDYAATELHQESTWNDATVPLFKGAATRYVLPWPSQGALTVLAKHVDRTGRRSTTAASVVITVDGAIYIGTGEVAPGAATEVFQATEAGPVGTTSDAAPVTFTPTAGARVIVSCEATISGTNSAAVARRFYCGVGVWLDGTSYGAQRISRMLAPGEAVAIPIVVQYAFVGLPTVSQTTSFIVTEQEPLSEVAVEAETIKTRVEVIKR